MHKTLRTRLVGIGLVVALLALAVPALAQNAWVKQASPATFPTQVMAVGVQAAGNVDAGTAGGGYPGGNLGYAYYSADAGMNFTQYALPPCPPFAGPGDDYTDILWDGAYGYTATWESGLYVYPGALPVTNPTCGVPFVNRHVQCLAIDPNATTGALPHDLFFGTWGSGAYMYEGITFTQIFNPLVDLVGGAAATPGMYFVHDIAVKQANCPAAPRLVFLATDGGGLLRGTQSCSTGLWSWSQVYDADLFIYDVTYDYANDVLYAGTKQHGIQLSTDDGATWQTLATSPAITTPVTDVLFVGFPNFVFAATQGQGVYRYDSDAGSFYQILNGNGTSDLTDLTVYDLAWDPGSTVLYAGTADALVPTQGNVWHIQFMPFTGTFTPTTPLEVGDAVNNCVAGIVPNQAPANWTAAITAGSLPPGMAPTVNNVPYPPAVCVAGAPTEDGCYDATLTVWDALINRTDFANADYTVNPGVAIDAQPNPAQYGTLVEFTSTVTGATGTVTYAWDFDVTNVSLLWLPGTDTSTQANPVVLFPEAGVYQVDLTVTDTGAAGGCTVTTTKTILVEVVGNLVVDPNATIVGSGAQFQFWANVSGGLPNCMTPSGYTFAWTFVDVQTSATITTSTLENPVITFPYTGTFKGTVTATDCSGHTATGFCVVNYNGFMSATVSSVCNPGPTGVPIAFYVSSHSIGPLASPPYTVTFSWGDGTPDVIVPTITGVGGFEEAFQNHTYAVAGSYNVLISIFDGGSNTTLVPYTQTIYPQFTGIAITASPNPASGCDLHIGETITFTVTPTGGIAPYLYSIDFGDGSTATVTQSGPATFSHAYAAASTYTVRAYVTDSGNCAVTNSTTYGPFNVVAEPTAAVTVNGLNCNTNGYGVEIPNLGVNPLAVSLGATYTAYAGHTVNYTWTYNNNWAADDPDTFSGSVVSPAPIPPFVENFYLGSESFRTFTATFTLTDTGFCVNDTVLTRTITFTIYNPLTVSAPSWGQACGSMAVTFNASASVFGGIPGYYYVWNFGDGTSEGPFSNPGPITHTYAAPGEYDAQLTVTDSAVPNCTGAANTANVTFHVTVVEPFAGTASASPTVGCSPLTVAFTSNVTGGGQPGTNLQLHWMATDGWDTGWVATTNPSHVFTATSSTVYTWYLYARSGINNSYECLIASGDIQVDVAASSLVIVPTSTSDYLPLDDTFTTTWNDGSAPITLTYTLTRIKDKNGNFITPEVDTVTVTNATSPFQFTYTFLKTGTWEVVCNLSDVCTASLASNTVTVQVLEPAALGGTTAVSPQVGVAPVTVNFSVVPTGGVPPYRFRWDFGDGSFSYEQNPSHIYTTPAIYQPFVQIGDAWPCADPGVDPACDAYLGVDSYMSGHWTAPIGVGQITVYAPLNAQASVSPALGMANATDFFFDGTVSGGDGSYTYEWSFGDGQTATTVDAYHTFNNPGTYSAVLTVHDGAGHTASSNAVLVTVYPALGITGSVTPTVVYPVPGSVAVTANAIGGDGNYSYYYQWETGGPFEGPFTGPLANSRNHEYSAPGTFEIQVKVVDGLGNQALLASPLQVTCYSLLSVNVVGSPVGSGDYVPKQYDFVATAVGGSGSYTYEWNFGDGATGSGAAPSHVYTVAGTYSVTCSVTDSVFHTAASNTFNLTVYSPLTVSASATPSEAFINQPFTFNAVALGGDGNYTYSWSGDFSASGATVNNSFATSGIKSATVLVTDGAGHSAQASVNVTVWDPLVVQASANPTQGVLNPNLPVAFSAVAQGGAGGYTYTWDFGDGTVGTGAAASHSYVNAGTYFAKVSVKDAANNQVTSANLQISAYAPLSVTMSGTPTSGILPLPVTFSAVAQGGDGQYTYTFDYGDGQTGASPNHTYSAAGTFVAHVTVSDAFGQTVSSNNVTIVVWAPLTATINANNLVGIKPFSVAFTSAVGGGDGVYTYNWNFGDGTSSALANPTKTFNAAGNYSVTLTVTDGSSHTVVSNVLNVVVYDPLSVTMSGTPTSGILPLPVTFSAVAQGGDGQYTYTFDYGDGQTGASPNHTYSAAGTFVAHVTVSDAFGQTVSSNNVTIVVWAPLTATINVSPLSGVKPFTPAFSANVAGGDGHYSYLWNFGDGTSSTSATPSKTYNQDGNFTVTLTVTDTASHSVVSNSVTLTVYAPLAVSASGTPSVIIEGNSVTFNAIAQGGDGNYTYAWTFGDGAIGSGATVSHVYARGSGVGPWVFNASVTVSDGAGHSVTSTSIAITVKPVPPQIDSSKKLTEPFRIVLYGTNFQSGCTATINGTGVTVKFVSSGKIKLLNAKSLCPNNVPVTIIVTNPDGGVSNPYQFTR